MFDIGFQELLLIGVVSLLIMGPERLPGAIRTSSLWISRLRNSFRDIKADIEREIGVDEIKQQIHNESIMKSLESAGSEFVEGTHQLKSDFERMGDHLPYDISDMGKSDSEKNEIADSESNNSQKDNDNSERDNPTQ